MDPRLMTVELDAPIIVSLRPHRAGGLAHP
jgi:hypothetical protein